MSTRKVDNSVSLEQEFYPLSSVEQALSAFAEYLTANLSTTGTTIRVDLTVLPQHAENARTVIREFLNYALDVTLKNYFVSAGARDL